MESSEGFTTITYSKVLVTKQLGEIDEALFARVSAEMAERAKVLCDALLEAMVTPLPPMGPEPFAYAGLRMTHYEANYPGPGRIVSRWIDPGIFYA